MFKKGLPRLVHRIAVASFFFLLGLCFSSWASRIPNIRQNLNLSDSELGIVLFALPVGLSLSLLISGGLISKFGSRKIMITAILVYGIVLLGIGFSFRNFFTLYLLYFFLAL